MAEQPGSAAGPDLAAREGKQAPVVAPVAPRAVDTPLPVAPGVRPRSGATGIRTPAVRPTRLERANLDPQAAISCMPRFAPATARPMTTNAQPKAMVPTSTPPMVVRLPMDIFRVDRPSASLACRIAK